MMQTKWRKKFKLSIHIPLQEKQVDEVLESFIRKIFVYGVWKEMTPQNILSGTSSTRFLKISFGKSLKQVLCMFRIQSWNLDYRRVSIPHPIHFPQKYSCYPWFLSKKVSDLYVVLMKLVNEICKMWLKKMWNKLLSIL